MIYICEKCGFTFERVSEVEACPNCLSPNVRYADDDETSNYKNDKKAGFPNRLKT